jgi:hypothetical protein
MSFQTNVPVTYVFHMKMLYTFTFVSLFALIGFTRYRKGDGAC